MSATEEQDAEWRGALTLWEQFPCDDENTTHETATRPMHPGAYFQLASVRGFCDVNGSTYAEYVDIWRARHDCVSTGGLNSTKSDAMAPAAQH